MDILLETFHIDWKLLIAQIINFAIVFVVLYRFVVKPLQKVMLERTMKIEQGLKDAENARAQLTNAESDYKEKIAEALRRSEELIEEARIKAEKAGAEAEEKTREKITKIIEDEKKKMEVERQKMMSEIKFGAAELVIAATEKILKEKIDPEKDRQMIESAILNCKEL